MGGVGLVRWCSWLLSELGSVIGCKQFSCGGDAVWRLVMGCCRMLSVEDRAAIVAGVGGGLVPDAYRPLDWAWPLGGVP